MPHESPLDQQRVATWRAGLEGHLRDWPRRRMVYALIHAVLRDQVTQPLPGDRWSQQPTAAPSNLRKLAQSLPSEISPRVLFHLFSDVKGPTGTYPPYTRTASDRLVDETVLDSFWPFRRGLVEEDRAGGYKPTELVVAYLRTLARWARYDPAVAACGAHDGVRLPICVGEDLRLLAARATPHLAGEGRGRAIVTAVAAAETVVNAVLGDRSITPAAACDLVRPNLERALRPRDNVVERLAQATADLVADEILDSDDAALRDAAERLLPMMLAAVDRLARMAHGGGHRG